MKKLVSIVFVMVLVLGMTSMAFAAPADFVDSIAEKPAPGLMSLGTCEEHGETVYAWLVAPDGTKTCLCGKEVVVTPLHEFASGEHHDALPQEVIDLIWQVYEELHSGDTDLEDIHGLVESIKAELGKLADEDHVSIYELFDVSILDKKTGELWQVPDGHSLTLKFDVQLPMGKFIEVMSYADDHWQLADHVENQGDGILVTFDHLCPVAILVEADDVAADGGAAGGSDDADKPSGGSDDADKPSGGADSDEEDGDVAKTGDESSPALWGGLAAAALAGLGILAGRRKKAAK